MEYSQKDLMRAEHGMRRAQSMIEFAWKLARYAEIYFEIYIDQDGNYPSATDVQRRFNHIVGKLAGTRSVIQALDDTEMQFEDNFPLQIIRQGPKGKTLFMPSDVYDRHNGEMPENNSTPGENINTSQAAENTGVSQNKPKSVDNLYNPDWE